MLVVGLTGGIGSGKSTVSALFAARGAPIIDADIIAREVTERDSPALAEIATHFGHHLIRADGSLDRSTLRDLIFNDPKERRWLESLLHPLIQVEIEKRLTTIHAPYCIVVIPLLLEVKPYPFIQRILVVDAAETTQIERVVARDKKADSHALAILKTQINREQRLRQADDIIHNDGSIDDLTPQVENLHKTYSQNKS